MDRMTMSDSSPDPTALLGRHTSNTRGNFFKETACCHHYGELCFEERDNTWRSSAPYKVPLSKNLHASSARPLNPTTLNPRSTAPADSASAPWCFSRPRGKARARARYKGGRRGSAWSSSRPCPFPSPSSPPGYPPRFGRRRRRAAGLRRLSEG